MHDFIVVENEPMAQGVMRLVMHAPALARALKPGQFVNIAVPGNAMSLLRVPLSFAFSDAETGDVEIWYAVVGDGTRRLAMMRPGDASTVLGPGGNGWTVPEDARDIELVAGGIGAPPIVSLAAAVRAASPETRIRSIMGARTASALAGLAELRAVSDEVLIATDDGSAGHHGFATDLLPGLLDEADFCATCGPEPMMATVARACDEADVFCEASVERMMSCGFGACATCAVETVNGMVGACMCGPIFDAKEVVW